MPLAALTQKVCDNRRAGLDAAAPLEDVQAERMPLIKGNFRECELCLVPTAHQLLYVAMHRGSHPDCAGIAACRTAIFLLTTHLPSEMAVANIDCSLACVAS